MKRGFFKLILLSALVCSCSNGKINSDLSAVDSLLQVPDRDATFANSAKAYEIVKGIVPDSLSTERERAMYNMLLTHAKFKNLNEITSDDSIRMEQAVAYFGRHKSDGNYYARSLIMKGYVDQRLTKNGGNAANALKWFQRALDELGDDEYYWRGYAHFRISSLLSGNWNMDSLLTRDHALAAMKYFEKCGDPIKVQWCEYQLGCHYFIQPNDSSIYYLEKIINAPKELADSELLVNANIAMCSVFHAREKFAEALEYAKEASKISDAIGFKRGKPLYHMASCYAHLGQLDSARTVILQMGEPREDSYLDSYARRTVAEAEGDYKSALDYADKYNRVRADVLQSATQKTMLRSELELSNARLERDVYSSQLTILWLVVICLIFLTVAMAILFILRRQRRAHKTLMLEKDVLRKDIESLLQSKDILRKDMQNELQTKDVLNKEFQTQMSLIIDSLSKVNDRAEAQAAVDSAKTELQSLNNEVFYKIVKSDTDLKTDGKMSQIEDKYPTLKHDDKMLICMLLNKFSFFTICGILGYKNERYVYTKRQRLLTRLNDEWLERLLT